MRILWAIESPSVPTGYGRTARELLPRLVKRGIDEYGLLAWSHWENGCRFDDTGIETILPERGKNGQPRSPWNEVDLERALQQFQPEVLVTVGNLHMLGCVPDVRSRSYVHWVGHFPIEGTPLPSWRLDTVAAMDGAVTFSEYGRETIETALPAVSCEVIPLGVNLRRFRPLRTRDRGVGA